MATTWPLATAQLDLTWWGETTIYHLNRWFNHHLVGLYFGRPSINNIRVRDIEPCPGPGGLSWWKPLNPKGWWNEPWNAGLVNRDPYLDGGFQILFIFTPKFGEDVQFDKYFSDGLKPPTSYKMLVISCYTPNINWVVWYNSSTNIHHIKQPNGAQLWVKCLTTLTSFCPHWWFRFRCGKLWSQNLPKRWHDFGKLRIHNLWLVQEFSETSSKRKLIIYLNKESQPTSLQTSSLFQRKTVQRQQNKSNRKAKFSPGVSVFCMANQPTSPPPN